MPEKTKPQYKYSAYYYYDTVTVTASSNNRIVFPVDLSYDFVATGISYKSSFSSANGIPTFTIMLKSNDKQLFQNAIPNELFFGIMTETSTAPDTRYAARTGEWERFEKPYLFPAKSDIIVVLYDTSGVNNTIGIALKGYKREKLQY